jgi:hypothetical protein
VSPTSKLMTTSTIIGRHNFIFDWTIGAIPAPEFQPTITALGTVPNWAPWESNGTDDGKTIDRINLVMLNGTMTSAQRQALVSAMAAIKNTDPALQTRRAPRRRCTSSPPRPSSKSIGKRMSVSRREMMQMVAGGSAVAALGQLGLSSALAADAGGYRAMVGVFLFGGNDAWNMVVPTDGRYADYAKQRGSSIALPQSSLVPLSGTAFGLHAAMAPLKAVWDDGGLGVVLNTGTLFAPLTKSLYTSRPDLRPMNLMSHEDQQNQWQGMRMRRSRTTTASWVGSTTAPRPPDLPPLISIAGSQLA